jgi:TRIAP1/MDM35 family protein
MESIGKECTELKHKYEECFNKWYSEKFLKGQLADTPCQDLFDNYRACLLVGYHVFS